MYLYLVHHGDAVAPEVDPGRPLSTQGLEAANRLAAEAGARAAKPAVVWHSGKLRARQTAEAFWSACNPRAEFATARDLSPDDFAVTFRAESAFQMAALVQLALRHPHVPPNVRVFGERFLVAARDYFADCPAALELMRRGDACD